MIDAHRPYSTAKTFCQGAFAMMANPDRFQTPDDTTFVLPFHHLVGFAVELYLKAFLNERGMSERELMRYPFGHNLQNLLSKAKEEGFECEGSDELVAYLRPHETYDYRYMKNDTTYELRPLHYVFSLLSALDRYVDITTGASAAHGREPGLGWFMPEEFGHWRMPS